MSIQFTRASQTSRVCVFIDGSNLYHGLQTNEGRTDIDILALARELCRPDRILMRTYYYIAREDQSANPTGYRQQQKFFWALQNLPYVELKEGRLSYRGGEKPREKGVDVQLAVDMVRFASNDNYDTAILVGGDEDFTYAVEAVKDMGKHVEVAGWRQKARSDSLGANLSIPLIKACDVLIEFSSEFLAHCWQTGSQK